MFMPRRLSRLTLTIQRVRVERVQDISDTDAIAEGIDDFFSGCYFKDYLSYSAARANFRRAWDSINSNWAENPWVWVVEFKACGTTNGT